MIISGRSEDDKLVLLRMFRFVGTYGLPLEVLLGVLQRDNFVLDIEDYIRDAMRDGAKFRTVRARLIAAYGDVYGQR